MKMMKEKVELAKPWRNVKARDEDEIVN